MARPRTTTALAVAALALLAVGGVLLVLQPWAPTGPECTVPGASGTAAATQPTVELTAAQLQHASTINAVGLARGLPDRARIIAVATAYQESSLRNRPDGDRDSVGLFQQRPSQGWGTAEEIIDPVYASNRFYDALVEVPDWTDLPLTVAAQAVQYSAFPDAYAQWEPQATTLVRELSGAEVVRASCRAGALPPTADAPLRPEIPDAATASPALAQLLAAAAAEFGALTVISTSDDGSTSVAATSLPGVDAERAGRALAAWTVAHATGAGVTAIELAGRRWADHEWSDVDPAAAGVGEVRIVVG